MVVDNNHHRLYLNYMKKTLLILSFCLAGCVSVPMTTIQIPTAHNRDIIVKAPKDVAIEGMEFNIGTNRFMMKSYKARMSPEVITSSAQGQLELMKEWRGMFNEAAALGAKAVIP